MKTKLILILIFIININANAQFETQQIITTDADGAVWVYAADFDGDGDIDVVSSSQNDNKIAWYENTDGLGSFGAQQIITTSAEESKLIYAADLDGDGDIDVLAASTDDDIISWYENTDGLGSFGAQQIISSIANGAYAVYASDLDGDGDMDVLSASFLDDKIAWYENTDGLGSFGDQQVITTIADGAVSVYATDIDGDGDIDVLSASTFDDQIAWYENTNGLGNFGAQQTITTITDKARTVYATDIDGDGDMDVLSASFEDDKIAWYENTDGLGTFGDQQIITLFTSGANSVYTSDIDGDGDMDVLAAASGNNHITWYENTDGLGNFGEEQIITNEAIQAKVVFATDIDGDGKIDVVSGSFGDDKIAWYKNLTTLGVNENSSINFSVYPIPTSSILTIQSKTTFARVEIYNQTGQLVISKTRQNKIDISKLNQGLYFIKVIDETGSFGIKKVVKE